MRTIRTLRSAAVALIALTAACSNESLTGARSQARVALDAFTPVYTQDFSGPVGAEWSNALESQAPAGEKFLGEFSTGATELSLAGLAAHDSITVTFDLYIIRSWDGADANWGTDAFTLTADGATLLNTTFSNNTWDGSQNYPAPLGGATNASQTGAFAINALGYTYWDNYPIDATYRLSFTFAHSASTLHLNFAALGLQDITDESWGLDNVVVSIGQ
ncbi:MAG TPA: hypothetical protein VE967_00920 [Gemmatimonadaceae bacterium]|nr:hypothetical protein [Gemmatimonadaceae bacterium]